VALDKAAVAHIAALARIRLADGELAALAADLSQILDWFAQLDEVDTSAVEPMASVAVNGLPVRDDRVTDGGCRDAILDNAPRSAGATDRAFFVVPKVIE
jgi:aspartyl-tRNA(Asn)/glutamyl-tRNA(Gln) amidotransferase subunit C